MELLFGNQKVVEADVPQQNGEQVRCGWRRSAADAATAAACHRPSSDCLDWQSCISSSIHASPTILTATYAFGGDRPQVTLAAAMAWARDNLLTERPELFMKGSSV